MMKLSLAAAVALAATLSTAFAADLSYKAAPLPAPALPSWTGFYIGANGGYGWSSFDTAFVPDPAGAFVAVGDLAGPTSFNTRATGGIFGGQIGYNWQTGNWVLGVEGDFDVGSISGTQNSIGGSPDSPTLPTTNSISATRKIDWLASMRAHWHSLGAGLALLYRRRRLGGSEIRSVGQRLR
jgi:outer membrane immunogenic protein